MQNKAQPLTTQRPQQHVFVQSGNITSLNTPNSFYIPTTFPVKEVRISVAYSIQSSAVDLFFITTDMPFLNRDAVIATCNTLNYVSAAPAYYYTDSVKDGNVISYILREPMVLAGSWNYIIESTLGTAPTAGYFILHFELLG